MKKKLITVVILVVTCLNLNATNINKMINDILNIGESFFTTAGMLTQNKEAKQLAKTFTLIEQLSCMETKFSLYFNIYSKNKMHQCDANLFNLQVESNLQIIASSVIEVMKNTALLSNIDITETVTSMAGDFSFMGVSLGSVSDKEDIQKRSSSEIIKDINILIVSTIKLMKSFNAKYETVSIEQLMKAQQQFRVKNENIFSIKTTNP